MTDRLSIVNGGIVDSVRVSAYADLAGALDISTPTAEVHIALRPSAVFDGEPEEWPNPSIVLQLVMARAVGTAIILATEDALEQLDEAPLTGTVSGTRQVRELIPDTDPAQRFVIRVRWPEGSIARYYKGMISTGLRFVDTPEEAAVFAPLAAADIVRVFLIDKLDPACVVEVMAAPDLMATAQRIVDHLAAGGSILDPAPSDAAPPVGCG